MKILIIEDQKDLAELVKIGLKKEGYAADYITDGITGQKRIELHHKDYDLVILDLMLPGKSGHEICREIRDLGISIPILILTARDSLESKLNLFEAGADDYLLKPFEFKELFARIKAVMRRPKEITPVKLQVQDLILDTSKRKAYRKDKEINLTLKEYGVLEYLMRNADRVVEREDLVNNIWDYDFDSFSNIVDVFINKLRDKIDKGNDRKIIETVRGIGYKLNSNQKTSLPA